MALSLSKLQELNSDVVGILEFDDKEVYEPIVQAPDNDNYVRRNIEKKYAAAGIPFISADGNAQSKNVVVYGHSSTYNNIIFTPLMQYINQNYYDTHPTFKFEMNNESRTYQIFSVLSFNTKDLNDSQEFMQTSWRKMSEFEDFVKEVKKHSVIKTDIDVSSEDKLMTLVTCDTRDNSKRVIIIAKLIS